jgi:hypothetical protein
MSDMIDLLPCPFCGGPDTRHFNNPDEFGRPSHGIQCANGECWVCGPECETPSEAIAAWNRRAALPPAPDAVGALVKAGEAHGLMLVPKKPTRKQCIAFAEIAIRNVDYEGPWDELIDSIDLALPALAAIRGGAK